jgi:hypothetical protein
VDDETGRPVDPFVVQEGRVDDKDPAKITWGYSERGTPWPNPEGRFDEQIQWGRGSRARIVAAGHLPQPILDKAPSAGLTQIKDLVVRLKRGREIAGRVLYHGPWYNPVQPTGVELHVTLSDKTYFEGDVKGPDGRPLSNALVRADSGPKQNPQVSITSVWTETVTLKEGETKAGVELEAPASTRFPSVEEQIRRMIEEQIRRETEKAAHPVTQPGHHGAAAAQTLSFGPVADGLQAAAEVSADEPFQVRFHIASVRAEKWARKHHVQNFAGPASMSRGRHGGGGGSGLLWQKVHIAQFSGVAIMVPCAQEMTAHRT